MEFGEGHYQTGECVDVFVSEEPSWSRNQDIEPDTQDLHTVSQKLDEINRYDDYVEGNDQEMDTLKVIDKEEDRKDVGDKDEADHGLTNGALKTGREESKTVENGLSGGEAGSSDCGVDCLYYTVTCCECVIF